jgi:glycosyltransferase involved in cell wall biosynthesis
MLKIKEKVIFTGYKTNVADYYNAMDIFLFPSLYEGLGITIIEAEINGLPCYISSDVIPMETHITNNVYPISLELSANEWAKIIDSRNNLRKNEIELIKAANYDIETAVKNLEKLFLSYIEGE